MRVSHRVSIVVFIVTGMIGLIAAVAVAVVRSPGWRTPADLADGSRHGPIAVVDLTPWDAGTIERLDQSDHTFVIRNEGDAPLQLTPGATSCSCTIAELSDKAIPPGGEGKVRVATKLTYEQKHDTLKAGRLRRAVHVHTNDPAHELLVLEIYTKVVRPLAAEPSAVILSWNPSLAPRGNPEAHAIVYSQTWGKFDLTASKCSLAAVKYHIEPAAPSALAMLKAKSGYRVDLSLPPDMPEGYFKGALDLSAKAAGQAPRALSLPIDGSIDGRVSLSGLKLDAARTLHLGTLDQGQSARAWFIVKVNDRRKSLVVRQIKTNPSFLQVRVAPFDGSTASGVYRVDVALRNAPPCSFMGAREGFIRIKTDHPRLPLIEVRVQLTVLSKT